MCLKNFRAYLSPSPMQALRNVIFLHGFSQCIRFTILYNSIYKVRLRKWRPLSSKHWSSLLLDNPPGNILCGPLHFIYGFRLTFKLEIIGICDYSVLINLHSVHAHASNYAYVGLIYICIVL